MSISLFVLFFFSTILLAYVFSYLLYNPSKLSEDIKDITNKGGLAVIMALSLGWIVTGIATPEASWPHSLYPFGLYPFMIAALSLSLYSIEKGKLHRFWIYLFITVMSVYFFPNDYMIFQGYLPLPVDRLLTAILWAFFIHIYVTLDKVKGMTLLQTQSLCFGFLIFPILYPFLFSFYFLAYPLLTIATLLGFMHYKKKVPYLVMGKTGAAPLGYIMGVFFIILISKGFWLTIFVMPIYYYFEMLYSLYVRFKHRKNPEPVVFTFYITHVIQKNLNAKGIMPFLLRRMFLFALLGVVVRNSLLAAFISCGIIFLEMFTRLNQWNQPKPKLWDLFKDVKQGSTTLWQTFKQDVQNIREIKSKK